MQRRSSSLPATLLAAFTALAVAAIVPVAAAPQHATSKSASSPSTSEPAPKHDLSGVWQLQGSGGAESMTPDKDMPSMIPSAKTRFDAEKPGYGPRAMPGGNDPILQCDPIGFPRVMYMPTPMEFVPAHDRILQFWEREHEWRPIWLDGRSAPEDADPTWFGYAVGHWEDDDTLVVQSNGFNNKTWLGPNGFPHSDQMRTTERYHRVDHDTILYDLTVTDPGAYTQPIVAKQRILKLKRGEEIGEQPCVWSQENEFAQRIRNPATPKK